MVEVVAVVGRKAEAGRREKTNVVERCSDRRLQVFLAILVASTWHSIIEVVSNVSKKAMRVEVHRNEARSLLYILLPVLQVAIPAASWTLCYRYHEPLCAGQSLLRQKNHHKKSQDTRGRSGPVPEGRLKSGSSTALELSRTDGSFLSPSSRNPYKIRTRRCPGSTTSSPESDEFRLVAPWNKAGVAGKDVAVSETELLQGHGPRGEHAINDAGSFFGRARAESQRADAIGVAELEDGEAMIMAALDQLLFGLKNQPKKGEPFSRCQ